MADNAIFKDYLAQIEQAYKAGKATEHTHRPALKSLSYANSMVERQACSWVRAEEINLMLNPVSF